VQPYCRAIQYVKYTVGAIVDFDLPEELKLLKDTVRKFVDRELIPLERECRPEGEDMPEQYIKPLQEKAKAIGLWLLDVPQEYGGAGLDLMSRCVIMEEVARTVAIPFRYAPIFGPEVRPVLFHCNEEQKKALSVSRDSRRETDLLRSDGAGCGQ
jgi:acyl-CoA dehydrogenase